MAAEFVAIAEGVVNELASELVAGTFGNWDYSLARSYGDWDMKLEQTAKPVFIDVVMVGSAITSERIGRYVMGYDVPVDIGVRKILTAAAESTYSQLRSRFDNGQIDALVNLVEMIHEFSTARTGG